MKPGYCMFTLRLPIDLKERTQAQAKHEGESMNQWIIDALLFALQVKEEESPNDIADDDARF